MKMKRTIMLSVLLVGYLLGNAQQLPLIPVADLSPDRERQVVIAPDTKDLYNGHPTTVLLADGQTVFCVWSYDHGGQCGPLTKSEDSGKTWKKLSTPDDWGNMENCPSIYRLMDKS